MINVHIGADGAAGPQAAACNFEEAGCRAGDHRGAAAGVGKEWIAKAERRGIWDGEFIRPYKFRAGEWEGARGSTKSPASASSRATSAARA